MKALIIILAGAIGLMGCTTMRHYGGGDVKDGEFSSAYSGTSEEPHSCGTPIECRNLSPCGKPVDCKDPFVRKLPKEAEAALAQVGIKDMAFLAAVDRYGEVRLLKPHDVKLEWFQLPQILNIQSFTQLLFLSYKGSDCMAAGVPGKRVRGYSAGGNYYAGFCKTTRDDRF